MKGARPRAAASSAFCRERARGPEASPRKRSVTCMVSGLSQERRRRPRRAARPRRRPLGADLVGQRHGDEEAQRLLGVRACGLHRRRVSWQALRRPPPARDPRRGPIDGQERRESGAGFLILLGIGKGDAEAQAKKSSWTRSPACACFSNAEGKFDLSVLDTKGAALVVSQFTLYGSAKGGRRRLHGRRRARGRRAALRALLRPCCARVRTCPSRPARSARACRWSSSTTGRSPCCSTPPSFSPPDAGPDPIICLRRIPLLMAVDKAS